MHPTNAGHNPSNPVHHSVVLESITDKSDEVNKMPNKNSSYSKRENDVLSRSVNVLNIVAVMLGASVTILTLFIVTIGYIGLSEYIRLKDDIRIDLEKAKTLAQRFDEIHTNAPQFQKKAFFKAEDYFNRGFDYYYNEQYDLALQDWDKAISLKPDYASAWNSKGVVLEKIGKYEDAVKAVEKAIEIKPDYAFAWNTKGIALEKLGRYEDAVRAAEMAIGQKSDFASAWNAKAVALEKLGKYKEAVKSVDRAIELKTDYAIAWNNKGALLIKLGKNEDALNAFNKAVELKPDYTVAKNNRDAVLKNISNHKN